MLDMPCVGSSYRFAPGNSNMVKDRGQWDVGHGGIGRMADVGVLGLGSSHRL